MVCQNLGGDRSGWLDTLPKHDLSIHWMGRMDHSHAAQRSGAERATDRVTLCIFGMFINAYGNSFWGQFPTMVISFTGLTFIMVGPYLDQEIQEKKSTDSNIKHHD